MEKINKVIRDCEIITWRGRGGCEMGKICPKTKSYRHFIKRKLISTPPDMMIILRLTPP